MKHKKLFITCIAIFTVLVALTIFLMIWYWGDSYNGGRTTEGFSDFRSEVAIPGLKDGACPQGITAYRANYKVTETVDGEEKEVTKSQNYFFISAYFKNQPSRVYVVGEDTGEVGYVTLKNEDGTDYTGHCGGIATNGVTLWVSSDSKVYVAKTGSTTTDNIAYDMIKLAAENGSVTFTASFNANCSASFLYYYQSSSSTPNSTSNKLYVGEFYRAGNYETEATHRLNTPNGDKNTAFVYEYSVAPTSNKTDYPYGLSPLTGSKDANGNQAPKIDKIFSITDEIQGFARIANGIVLSQSYGLKNSHIYYYKFDWSSSTSKNNTYKKYTEIEKDDEDKNKPYKEGFKYDGVTRTSGAPYYDANLNVYFIDRAAMLSDYSIPSMSEGLCTAGDRVYVLFESGASKYKTFVRQQIKNVYSFIPRKSDKL